MPKVNDPKTYFEQVPLEIVKKIAEVEMPGDKTHGAGVPVRSPGKKVICRRGLEADGMAGKSRRADRKANGRRT